MKKNMDILNENNKIKQEVVEQIKDGTMGIREEVAIVILDDMVEDYIISNVTKLYGSEHELYEYTLEIDYQDRVVIEDSLKEYLEVEGLESVIDGSFEDWLMESVENGFDFSFLRMEYDSRLERFIDDEVALEVMRDYYVDGGIMWDFIMVDYRLDSIVSDMVVPINIELATYDELNHDKTFISDIVHMFGRYNKSQSDEDREDIEGYISNSGLHTLLESQGYTPNELIECFENKLADTFLESIIQELNNFTTSMGTINILAKTDIGTLRELDGQIRDKSGRVLISKDSMVGILDVDSGGGSVFGIELHEDIVVRSEDVQIGSVDMNREKYTIQLDGADGYSVYAIYGLDNHNRRDLEIL